MEGRQLKRKTIKFGASSDPEQDQNIGIEIFIPVVVALPFVGTNGQIFNYRVDNTSENKSRQTKNHTVKSAVFNSENEEIVYDDSMRVEVERIQVGRFIGTNGQIFNHKFRNDDPAPKTPEAAAGLQQDEVGHYKVHYVRYYQNNDDQNGNWVDIEYIDRLKIVGTNGQIFNYKFRSPDTEYFKQFGESPAGKTYGDPIEDESDPYNQDPDKPIILGFCDFNNLEDITAEEGSSIDPPYRLDPLQNIVNLSGQTMAFTWVYNAEVRSASQGIPPNGGYHWVNVYNPDDPEETSGTTFDGKPFTISGKPTIPDMPFTSATFGWWTGGPNTDTTAKPGMNYYKVDGPGAIVSHSWNFYALTGGGVFVASGTASASFGPVTLTVDDQEWVCQYVQIAMYCWAEAKFGSTVTWMPSFTASFKPG